MSAQRFVGANSREAMNQVRLALGEDALILSSHMTDEGVEIMALVEEPSTAPVSIQHAASAYADQMGTRPALPEPAQTPPAQAPAAMDLDALGSRLLQEIHDMRQLIDRQAPPGAGERKPWVQWLLDAGFSASLSEELVGTAPPLQGSDATPARRQAWLAQKLDSQLNRLDDEDTLFDGTAVIALVGPTGVGKTTTTAKLAARYVMRHGPDQVALISTDSFRIGAHEQLKIYAQLLDVELHTLGPAASLEPLLASLADKRLVIIDTVGMSQRDERLLTQINQLGANGRTLRLMLVVNAASHGDTLDEVVRTYRDAAHAAGCRLDDCIVSKCDEAARLGPALDTVIRHGLRLNYLSVGQQVPEDLQLPGASTFLQQALDVSRPSLFAAQPTTAARPIDALVRGLLGRRREILALRNTLVESIEGFAPLLEAWHLMGLPLVQQQQGWSEFLSVQELRAPAAPSGRLLWGASQPTAGATWHMPLLTLDRAGQLNARPWLTHRMPIGARARLDWCQSRWPTHRHLWPACPGGDLLETLRFGDQAWLGAVKGNQRVQYQGEAQRLRTLARHSETFEVCELRYRQRNTRLTLSHLPVALKGAPSTNVRAWFGLLQDNHSGQLLAQRWWLAGEPADGQLADQASDLLLALKYDRLAALTGRGWALLLDVQPRLQADLRLYLAAGLAATAVRLATANDDQAFQVRAQLLGLLGKKTSGQASDVLEGLLHLLTVSDALTRTDDTPVNGNP